MTSALEQEAAEQGAIPFPPNSVIEFSPFQYQKVSVYLTGDEAFDNESIDYALKRYWHGHVRNLEFERQVNAALGKIAAPSQPADQPANRPQRPTPQRQQQGGGGQQFSYPPKGLVSTLNDNPTWACDKCGSTGEGVARRTQTGRMKSDAIVCLNPACKEGDFRYTIAWDEGAVGPADNGQPELDPASLPF